MKIMSSGPATNLLTSTFHLAGGEKWSITEAI